MLKMSMIKYYLMAGALAVASLGGYKVADWQWSAKWSAHMAADAEANKKAAQDAIDKQNELSAQLDKVQNNAKERIIEVNADSDRLAGDVSKLREQLKLSDIKYKNANSTIADLRRAAATDTVVREELLNWTIGAAQELAIFATRSREAGLACQSVYKAIKDSES